MANFDIIEDAAPREDNERISYDDHVIDVTPEPIVIRGVGQVTLFGLSNKFDLEFPSGLTSKARHSIEKIIDAENCNLYHKLGLHWKLQKQMMTSSNMMEYVLVIEFRPKQPILKPD